MSRALPDDVLRRAPRLLAIAGLLALATAPAWLPPFWLTLLNDVGMSSLVVLGLVLLTGVGGLTSFGQAAFVGLGAYTSAVLTTGALSLPASCAWLGSSPWMGLLAGLVVSGIVALALGALTLKLSGHFLPLGTIAWGLSLYFVFGTVPMLGGQTGMSGIPPIRLLGRTLDQAQGACPLIWLFVGLAALALRNLLDSREGRAIRALRGGTLMAEAMGVDTLRARLLIFVIAALLASVSGWLYAHTQRFLNPSPFGMQRGIDYLFMAVIGGAGQVWGALLGAGVLTVLKQWLQDLLPRLLGRNGNFEVIVFGTLMILILQRTRQGLWPLLAGWLPQRRPLPARALEAAGPLPGRPLPPRGERLLEAQAVTRRFGGLLANDAMSLVVHAGEILALIGPNGAGKSTLFDLLSGIDRPSAGQIVFRGRLVAGCGARAIARLGLSRSFQHVRVLGAMSVLDNIALGAHLRGRRGVLAAACRLDRGEEARLLAEAARQARRVGLAAQLQLPAGSLALGQQRLLEIARALCADPCVLLLDEPAAGLRRLEKQALAELLARLRDAGLAILLVEHDMDFVMGLADRVVVMDFGRKIAEGPPAEVQSDAAVQAAYLGGFQ